MDVICVNNKLDRKFTIGKAYKKLFYGSYNYKNYYLVIDDEGTPGFYKEDKVDWHFTTIGEYRDSIIDMLIKS